MLKTFIILNYFDNAFNFFQVASIIYVDRAINVGWNTLFKLKSHDLSTPGLSAHNIFNYHIKDNYNIIIGIPKKPPASCVRLHSFMSNKLFT
jgi:hypothetical protein